MDPHPAPDPDVTAIILAAGASRRLGSPKQLLRLQGEPLLQRTLRLAAAVCSRVVLVVGAHADSLLEAVPLYGAQVVVNPDWPEGMGSSVRAGLAAARQRNPAPGAALFLVVDQPLLTEGLLRQLIAAYHTRGHGIVAADYGPRLGVPALFDQAYFPKLLRLRGDRGARSLLRQAAEDVQALPFPGGAVDLDTPEDVARFRRNPGNAD